MQSNQTVLVIEDELLIALDIQSQLEELGIGNVLASTLSDAIAVLDEGNIALVMLDCDLRGQTTAPLVALLGEMNIPFVVCSGSSEGELEPAFAGAPYLGKPFSVRELEERVGSVFAAA